MPRRVDLHSLRESLIESIDTDLDSRVLLERMARQIGEAFGASACLLVAGGNSSAPTAVGFWHEADRSFALSGALSLASDETKIGAGRVVRLNEIAGTDWRWWESIAPLNSSWGIGITFRGVRNGIALIGTDRVTDFEAEALAGIAKTIGIAYGTLPLAPDPVSPSDRVDSSTLFASGIRDRLGAANPIALRLYEVIRQQLEQQRQLNEMKDDIIAAISDRARNPLATMKMVIDALSDPNRPISDSSRENYWRILKQEWNTLKQLIDNIVILKQLEAREITFSPQPVNLEILLREVTTPIQERWREDKRKSVQLKVEYCLEEGRQTIETDPQHLRTILHELLVNAGNFALAETTAIVEVRESEKNEIEIIISDTGLGIAPEERELIFEPFRRGQGITDRAIAGTGIGLALVRGLLDLLGGRIEVKSDPIADSNDYFTVFTVTLPRSLSERNSG